MCASGTDRSLGRCDTEGCHRDAVVTHHYADLDTATGVVEADLCLPCRRVIEHARGIPWNDDGDDWAALEAREEFDEGGDVDRRYVDAATGQPASSNGGVSEDE